MTKLFAAVAALAALIVLSTPGAHAQGVKAGSLELTDTWARASAGHESNGAAYVTIANHGAQADRLTGAMSDVAEKTQIHNNIMEDGIMKMRQVDGIDIPAAGSVKLQPGGYHIMLVGLKAPLQDGQDLALTLTFEKAGQVEIHAPVRKIGGGAMNMKHPAQ